jgi:hypothetical protein
MVALTRPRNPIQERGEGTSTAIKIRKIGEWFTLSATVNRTSRGVKLLPRLASTETK